MMRRLLAWVMLILFVLLIVNLLIFRVFMTESVMLYVLMVVLFFFSRLFNRGDVDQRPAERNGGPDEEEESGDQSGSNE